MILKNDINYSHNDYIQKAVHEKEFYDDSDALQILKDFQKLAHLPYHLLPAFYIIDYTKRKYVFCTEGIKRILGYEIKEVIDGGHLFFLEIQQKEFYKTFNEVIFPSSLNFLRNKHPVDHLNYTFSHNTQMKNIEGKWVNLLQRSNYITSKESGLPLYNLGMLVDISCFKKDNVIIHTIEKSGANSGTCQIVDKNYYFPFDEDQLLTKQEKNILKYMAEGLSSKMLADKLCISENTVSNHRQNIIRKTNTKNVAQLIAFAIRNGII